MELGRVDGAAQRRGTRRRRELRLPIVVEFEDVDSYQIVHHTRLVAYLERARLRLLAELGFSLSRLHLAPVLYELQVRFRKPARLLDELEVVASVLDFDDYQVGLGYRIRRGGDTIARARSIIAFADLDDGALRPMPAELRAALAEGGQEPGGRGIVEGTRSVV